MPAIENGTTPKVQEVMPVSSPTAAATNEGSLPSAQISNQVPIIEDEATPTNQGSVAARMTLSEEVNRTKPTSSSSKGGEVDNVVTSLPSAIKSNQMPNTEHDATPATEVRNAARMLSSSTAASTNRGGKPHPAPHLRGPANFEDESDINGGFPMNEDEGVSDDHHPHNQENETYQNRLPPTSIRLASRKQGVDRDWEKYRKVWRAALKRKFPQGKKAVPFKRSENDPTGERNWGSFMSCFTE